MEVKQREDDWRPTQGLKLVVERLRAGVKNRHVGEERSMGRELEWTEVSVEEGNVWQHWNTRKKDKGVKQTAWDPEFR